MKNLEKMNVNKLYIIFLLVPFFCFSQKEKEDVYFLLDNNHSEYILSTSQGKIKTKGQYSNFGIIYLTNKKQYVVHQKKVKEAKANGTYEFDPESGRDNLNMDVFSFEFSVISKRKDN